MKNLRNLLLFLTLIISLTSCELVGTIFKGGVWTGVILVFAVIGGIIWMLAKLFGGSKS